MKKFLLFFIFIYLYGYMAKVEPFDTFNIKASVSGKVIATFKNLEAENINNKIIVKLDSNQEEIDLKNTISQIKILKEEIKNQEKIVKRKKETYLRYKRLKSKSVDEKNMKFYDYIASFNQLLVLKSNLATLEDKKEKLLDILNKKNIKFTGYLTEIVVSKGDYVNPGVLVAKGYDVSKQKLYIYVPIDKIDTIKDKTVYINNKKSNFKIYKIWKVPDIKYVTSYKVELIGNGLKFGDIVNVSFH